MLASFLMLIALASVNAQVEQPIVAPQETQTQVPAQTPVQPAAEQVPEESQVAEAGADFNQEFAFRHLKAICAIGPRMSTTAGMTAQQTMLQKHFEALGAQVGYQNFLTSTTLASQALRPSCRIWWFAFTRNAKSV